MIHNTVKLGCRIKKWPRRCANTQVKGLFVSFYPDRGQRGDIGLDPRHRGRGGQVIGGALSETMPPLNVMPEFREDDPFLAASFVAYEAVYAQLGAQDAKALTALSEKYPEFRKAYGIVGSGS